jgi:hypothetical protein
MAERDWWCPLCGLERMPYGTTCKRKPCENPPHITGKFYVGEKIVEDSDWKPSKHEEKSESIGIASISNENDGL